MNVCYGIVLDRTGTTATNVLERGAHGPRLRTQAWSSPAASIRRDQPNPLYVDRDHDRRACGRVLDLALRGGHLWAVAELRDDVGPYVRVRVGDELRLVESPFYFSASRWDVDGELVLHSLAVTPTPARVGARGRPLVFREGGAYLASRQSADAFERELLEAAAETDRRRRHDQPIYVRDPAGDARLERGSTYHALVREDAQYGRPRGVIWHGARAPVLSVR